MDDRVQVSTFVVVIKMLEVVMVSPTSSCCSSVKSSSDEYPSR